MELKFLWTPAIFFVSFVFAIGIYRNRFKNTEKNTKQNTKTMALHTADIAALKVDVLKNADDCRVLDIKCDRYEGQCVNRYSEIYRKIDEKSNETNSEIKKISGSLTKWAAGESKYQRIVATNLKLVNHFITHELGDKVSPTIAALMTDSKRELESFLKKERST